MRLVLQLLSALLIACAPALAAAQSEAEAGRVLVIDVQGAIGPSAAHHIENGVAAAKARGAEALIVRLDTPGGLVTSTREIVADILAAETPVIVYVAPSGGRAASAGAFILYAGHLAAMAPGTNVGAATPIQLGGAPKPLAPRPPEGGEDADPVKDETPPRSPTAPTDAASAKAVNDAAAYIRSLAELRGRNADWAESAVRDAASLSAEAALKAGVIDVIAAETDALVAELDGRTVSLGDAPRTLRTMGAEIELLEPSAITELLSVVANPNVAFLLMTLGVYGLIFELANPGFGPGVPGVICLVVGLYALNQLPLDYAGLALVALGVAFMALEAATPSVGVLGIGGVIAFAIGAAMLVDTDVPEYQLSWSVIAATAAGGALFMSLALGVVFRAQRRPARMGAASEIGQRVEVIEWRAGEGHVWHQGERWRAAGPEALRPGDEAEIVGVADLTLTVRAIGAAAAP